MNKFAIMSVLFAVVAVASASPVALGDNEEFSELQLRPDDDGEVAYLAQEHQIFGDFCKNARDEVFSFASEKKKEGVASLFATFFGSIDEVTEALREVQKTEGDKASKSIVVEKEDSSEGILKKMSGAMTSYVKALGAAAFTEIESRLALLKMSLNQDSAQELVQQTCGQIQLTLQPRLQKLFKDAKAEIVASGPSAEVKAAVASAQYEKVGCITAGRINKIVKVCGFLSGSVPMLMELAGK